MRKGDEGNMGTKEAPVSPAAFGPWTLVQRSNRRAARLGKAKYGNANFWATVLRVTQIKGRRYAIPCILAMLLEVNQQHSFGIQMQKRYAALPLQIRMSLQRIWIRVIAHEKFQTRIWARINQEANRGRV